MSSSSAMRSDSQESGAVATPSDRTFVAKTRERLRYGLLTQEVLDRIAHTGLVFYPYFVVRESASLEHEQAPQPDSITFASLEKDQAELVVAARSGSPPLEKVLERMDKAECFGVFENGELAGYSWASYAAVVPPLGRGVLFELDERGVYLFDLYVCRPYRGRRLAPWLRQCIHRRMLQIGRDDIYSITLAHNRSSRRFKVRFGAVEVEKRLLWGLKSRVMFDVRLRRLEGPSAPSPAWLTVNPRSQND